MATLPLAFLVTSALLLLTCTSHLKYPRFVLIRSEIIHIVLFVLCSYFYIRWLLSRLVPRIRGINLMCFDLSQHLKFNPPEFIDKGFSDLTKYEQFWKMKHKIFSYCATQGYRPYMEDRMHYMYDPNNNLSIFGIFDGHGGLYVSDFLESNFAKSIRERFLRFGARRKLSIEGMLDVKDPVEEMLVTEVHRLDDVLSRIDPNCTALTGSTMIAAIMEDNRYLSVINVGDSRAVACDSQNCAIALSKDHKPDDPSERRRIEHAGGFVSLDGGAHRVQGILAVSRSFGDTLLKRLGVLTVHPDVLRIDLDCKPLKFLIVGTDGFWDVVSSQEAVRFANDYLRSHEKRDWHRISTFLVQIALSRHTLDNVSVLFIKLQ